MCVPASSQVVPGPEPVRTTAGAEPQLTQIESPVDVTSTNTIAYDQIAEARVSCRGRGQISPPAAQVGAAGARHYLPVLGGAGSRT
ncbi:MAG: hypothetical protein CL566_06105 [Alphaproteobacteria bacterium]|nr:hypothetical protein [Alphaproteobacteria bacterium]